MTDTPENWDTLIEVSPAETRIAVVDSNSVLRRFRIERINAKSPVGAIYKARITKLDKGSGGAFLDLGDPLLGDVFLPKYPKNLTQGQYVMAQVIRAPDRNKGAAITLKPALKGRYCTYFPNSNACTVDKRCGQGKRRAELEALLGSLKPETGGLMINWAAFCATESEIAGELRDLSERWLVISGNYDKAERSCRIAAAPDAVTSAILDAPPEGRIAIDDRRIHAHVKSRIDAVWPDLADGLLFHDPRQPLFGAVGIDDEVETLSDRIVSIPGGGSLSIDRVEAMTAIDVNLSSSDTVPDGFAGSVKLNLRAVEEVARQIELRNLSGLILIDFVSMRKKEDRKRIVEAMRKAVRNASSVTDVLGMTASGFVEVTRQRNEPMISDMLLSAPREPETHPAADAAAALRALVRTRGAGRPVIRAPEMVLELLRTEFVEAVRDTEQRLGQSISLEAQTSKHWEVLLQR